VPVDQDEATPALPLRRTTVFGGGEPASLAKEIERAVFRVRHDRDVASVQTEADRGPLDRGRTNEAGAVLARL
jgi:hypothetical protein